jgi:hypothetical protein
VASSAGGTVCGEFAALRWPRTQQGCPIATNNPPYARPIKTGPPAAGCGNWALYNVHAAPSVRG